MMIKEKKKNVREEKKETETTDIYDEEQLEKMLENDEITEAEYSFMLGREEGTKKKNMVLERKEHEDTHSGELAKSEYEDD